VFTFIVQNDVVMKNIFLQCNGDENDYLTR